MASVFEEIASKFGVSKAIFGVGLDTNDSSRINIYVKNPYSPSIDIKADGDPLERLVASVYRERYDNVSMKFEHAFSGDDAYYTIISDMIKTYKEISPLKNPKQSKLFRWLHSVPKSITNNPSAQGFIGLYRYIRTNRTHMRRGSEHASNVLAILEMMRHKYEHKK